MKSFILLTLVLWAAVNCASLNLGRIIGGHEAEVGEAPYILQFRDERYFCAGVLIFPNWVLTAARCLKPRERFGVFAGMHAANGTKDPEVQFRQIRSSKQYVLHNVYASGDVDLVDLGLLYIDPPFDVEKSARVKSIALAAEKYEHFTPGKLYGWGSMESGAYPTNLRTIDVNFVSYEGCWDYYLPSEPFKIYNICAKDPIDSCSGDSGGPLIHKTPEGVELVGIISFTGMPSDDKTGNPSACINVALFSEWISNTTRDFVAPSSWPPHPKARR